jgi:glucose/mannose-6-phosphate isomerase
MLILDDYKRIKKLNKNHVLESIEFLPKQCQQAWQEVKKVTLPRSYKSVKNIVINGMGGSGLGGHVIQSLYYRKLKIPLQVIHTYNLPAFVNQNTLYIISSYSGTTEEPISTFIEAKKRKAKILVITTGEKLGYLATKYKVPAYIFKPDYNLSNIPRFGLGYSIIGIIGFLNNCQLLRISNFEIRSVINLLKKCNHKYGTENRAKNNLAKQTALSLKFKAPIIVGAEFLIANAHVLSYQINETSKTFATYFAIPELNHHLMESLKNPLLCRKILKFLFIESNLYLSRNQTRFKITEKVVKKNQIDFIKFQLQNKNELLQSFETLSFGSYLSFYLAVLNKVNPAKIPWVDYFKKELVKKY